MIAIDVLRESETGGVKSYTVARKIYATSHGEQGRAQDIGGAFVNVNVLFFTTGYNLTEGSMVRYSGRTFRIQTIGLRGMAGLKRYEATETDDE